MAEKEIRLRPISASTTDDISQGVEQTVDGDPSSYWCSSGTISANVDDYLIYQLPENYQVTRVEMITGVATFAAGSPFNPPKEVSFAIGSSKDSMVFTSDKFKYPNDKQERVAKFALRGQPQGKFVKVVLHGKTQKVQYMYYNVIQSVRIWGISVDEYAVQPPQENNNNNDNDNNNNNNKNALEEKDQCIICFEKRRDAAIIPCGHLSSCMECIEDVKARGGVCPQCRGGITSVLKIFHS